MSFPGYRPQLRIALLVACALSGCAGNGQGLDANGNPTSGGSAPEPLTATFKSIQDNVFTPICTKCHIGAGAPEGLQLDEAHSYALLVGVASTEQPNVVRVAANDPDSSYIIRKLQGTPGISGQQMPFGGPYLPQSTIDIIRQWIIDGAQQSAPASLESSLKSVQRFVVTSSSPDPDSIVSQALPQIVVAFNGDIDSTQLAQSVTLVRADSDANPPAAIPIVATVPRGDGSAMLIKPQTPLTDGTYRVTLQRSLANMNAQPLGADYSFTFTVDSLQ
jgi:methionine-rich copper-binding protein CopC